MKASKTRELIDLSINVAFENTKKDNKQLHELCQKADEELQRLECLAKIGRATELAFEEGYIFCFKRPDETILECMNNVDELLKEKN